MLRGYDDLRVTEEETKSWRGSNLSAGAAGPIAKPGILPTPLDPSVPEAPFSPLCAWPVSAGRTDRAASKGRCARWSRLLGHRSSPSQGDKVITLFHTRPWEEEVSHIAHH